MDINACSDIGNMKGTNQTLNNITLALQFFPLSSTELTEGPIPNNVKSVMLQYTNIYCFKYFVTMPISTESLIFVEQMNTGEGANIHHVLISHLYY